MIVENKNKKLEKFLIKSKIRFGDKYDYSLVLDILPKIKIRCMEHNIIFEQCPSEHLRGRACCTGCRSQIIDTKSFIVKAIETHGNKYRYDLSDYILSSSKVKIMCPEHGVFEQLPINHVNGQGCPKCGVRTRAKNKTLTSELFIKKSKLKHGDKYDYSKCVYKNKNDNVIIICPIHGEIEQVASSHIKGRGCYKCCTDNKKKQFTKTKEEFIKDAIEAHGDKYDYSKVEYINSQTKVIIMCSKHGEFEQLPYDHIGKHGCVKCSSSISKAEVEISTYIESLGVTTQTSSISIIPPNQLDIYIPSHKIAIEYNGLYYHNETRVDKNYHLNKTIECEKLGIQLIHIFEDEWLAKEEIVKSRLRNILGLTENKVFGRKCIIKDVVSSESRVFLDNNHIQGSINARVRIGLYYNDELVSLMCFNKPRAGIGSKYDGYELSRFCNKLNTSVIGGGDKLLKYFIKTYQPNEIISYADRRWSNGNLYEKLGFTMKSISKPNYWYIFGKKRKHRFGFRKSVLIKEGFDTNKSEHQIMLDREIYRIYDSGTKTYSLTC